MDALRWDYLDHMVYLKEIADKNIFVEKLKPSAGFCERVEVLTGVPNVQSGYFTAIDRLNPELSYTFFLSVNKGVGVI